MLSREEAKVVNYTVSCCSGFTEGQLSSITGQKHLGDWLHGSMPRPSCKTWHWLLLNLGQCVKHSCHLEYNYFSVIGLKIKSPWRGYEALCRVHHVTPERPHQSQREEEMHSWHQGHELNKQTNKQTLLSSKEYIIYGVCMQENKSSWKRLQITSWTVTIIFGSKLVILIEVVGCVWKCLVNLSTLDVGFTIVNLHQQQIVV